MQKVSAWYTTCRQSLWYSHDKIYINFLTAKWFSFTSLLCHFITGVAFEQGKMLPTPETVPFRLTRDLVDGMGISGVEGVFRRCCEKTIEVMRTSQEALLTIVEVSDFDYF